MVPAYAYALQARAHTGPHATAGMHAVTGPAPMTRSGELARAPAFAHVHTCVSGCSTASQRVRARHSSLLLVPAGSRPSAAGNAALSCARLGLTRVRCRAGHENGRRPSLLQHAPLTACTRTHVYACTHIACIHKYMHEAARRTRTQPSLKCFSLSFALASSSVLERGRAQQHVSAPAPRQQPHTTRRGGREQKHTW